MSLDLYDVCLAMADWNGPWPDSSNDSSDDVQDNDFAWYLGGQDSPDGSDNEEYEHDERCELFV